MEICIYINNVYAVAEWLERSTDYQEVAGSNPSGETWASSFNPHCLSDLLCKFGDPSINNKQEIQLRDYRTRIPI